MTDTFKFELVSPERVLVSAEVEQVLVPGSEGDFAVLAGHAPVLSMLRPGVLDVQLPGKRHRLFVKGGFAEVEPDRLTVLAQTAVDVDQLGAADLAEELKIAEAEVAAATDDETRRLAHSAIDQLKTLQAQSRAA